MHGWCDFSADPDSSRYREMIDLAVEAGAGNLLIIPGMLQTDDTSHAIDAMVQGMRKAVQYGREKGIPLLMEDFDGLLSPYNSIFGLQYFMNAVDGLGCAFDTGNFVIFHENELKAFDLFADKIQTVHLKDRSMDPVHPNGYPNICADQKPAWACAIGSGYIHIREILHRLTARNYTGNIIVELKAVQELENLHRAQTINYSKVANAKVALLINFCTESLEYERLFPRSRSASG